MKLEIGVNLKVGESFSGLVQYTGDPEKDDLSFNVIGTHGRFVEVWLPSDPTYNMPDEIQGNYPENCDRVTITKIGVSEHRSSEHCDGEIFKIVRNCH